MALDRDSTLKKAEKLLRQGKLEGAIAEYVRLVEDQPRDWATANMLGDLYAKNGRQSEAVAQYTRIADHFLEEGFYPKAAALYKKILKIEPESESIQLQLAEISARQGLLADAKSHLNSIAGRRRKRGDRRGTAEIIVRLGDVDPADFEARQLAARTLEEMGEDEQAAGKFKALHDDLTEKGRSAEALEALREYVRLSPTDPSARASLARIALDSGDITQARELLDRETAGSDPVLLQALIDMELRAGGIERARELLPLLLAGDPDLRHRIVELGSSLVGSNGPAAFACIDAAVDAAIVVADFGGAATILRDYVGRVPRDIPALLKLVEVCVDGGLETEMYRAQEQLTDAYLASGQGAEARVIAEDLVAREPWEPAHIDRFRRALVILRISDPDTLIAERLSGQVPFMAKDPFFEMTQPPPAEPEPEPGEKPLPMEAAETSAPETPPGGDPDVPVDPADDPEAPPSLMPVAIREPAPAPITVKPAADSASFDEIDLTGALGGMDPAAPRSAPERDLNRAFGEIRDKAGDANPDYSAQHMTLARTYLEIGMTDEAIASLKTAERSPRHRFEAAALLGRLYRQRDEPGDAIEWLERAAEAPAPDAEAGRSLLYDLGVLLDEAGEVTRALAVLLELQADAGDYRDVPSRIDRLARAQHGG